MNKCETLAHKPDNILTLTVNQRLALELTRSHSRTQHAEEHLTWQTPQIMPLTAWLSTLWGQYSYTTDDLATPWQINCLWQQIIEQNSENALLNIPNTASLAQSAWTTLQQWNIPLTILQHDPNAEIQQFYRWAYAFEALLSEKSLITPAQLPMAIDQLDHLEHIPLPQQIILRGFDQITPAIKHLISTLKQFSQITIHQPQAKKVNIERVCFDTQRQEIESMAQRTKARLDSHPSEKIACIIPQLTDLRPMIKQIFTDTFCNEDFLPGQTSLASYYFNISAARPLTDYPMIETIKHVLACLSGTLKSDQLSFLLQSPYLTKTTKDIDLGAIVDTRLKQLNEVNIQISDIFSIISQLPCATDAALWADQWRAFNQAIKSMPTHQLASQWSHTFKDLLALLNWPSQRTLNSEEYQLEARFYKCLHEFCELDTIYPAIDRAHATRLFTQLIQQTTFQPEGSEAPIQILGLLESSGLAFDTVFMAGLDDENWPPPASPNPFLPITLQRQHQMPHSDANKELNFCKISMQRIQDNCATLIYSHCTNKGDKLMKASPLIADIPLGKHNHTSHSNSRTYTPPIDDTQLLESLNDTYGTPLPQEKQTKGGSRILKEQAACPFRAYAYLRLAAQSSKPPQLGLTPAQRGTIVHDVLDRLWEEISTHDQLISLDDETLQAIITRHISQTLQEMPFYSSRRTNQLFLSNEKIRLGQLINTWLTLEKKRQPFAVIAREQAHTITIEDLTINLRVDRVDELADGAQLIIDYKTGPSGINTWAEPIQDPQLPLYCIHYDTTNTPVAALAFAEIIPGKVNLKGVIDKTHSDMCTADIIPIDDNKSLSTWPQQIEQWRTSIHCLAREYTEGLAARQPRHAKACLTCDLQPLCRVHES